MKLFRLIGLCVLMLFGLLCTGSAAKAADLLKITFDSPKEGAVVTPNARGTVEFWVTFTTTTGESLIRHAQIQPPTGRPLDVFATPLVRRITLRYGWYCKNIQSGEYIVTGYVMARKGEEIYVLSVPMKFTLKNPALPAPPATPAKAPERPVEELKPAPVIVEAPAKS